MTNHFDILKDIIEKLAVKAMDRNIIVYDADATTFSTRLVALLKTTFQRNQRQRANNQELDKIKTIIVEEGTVFDGLQYGVNVTSIDGISLTSIIQTNFQNIYRPEGKNNYCLAIGEKCGVLLGVY